MGNADNLLFCGETLDQETRRQLYTDIYDDAQWLNGMVENLLSASRMNDGRLSLNMTTELMSDMVAEAVRHMGRRLDGHRLEVTEPDSLLFVRADARLIVQVVINLLDNAVKYAPMGSQISIGISEARENVLVRIADDGPGIPDDQKPYVFDLFFTSGNPTGDSRRGLGIGLSLCQSIIRAHSGAITVTDNAPHGAVFAFTLPRDEVCMNE
jgi:two-component system sensor histidine kinase KdpD